MSRVRAWMIATVSACLACSRFGEDSNEAPVPADASPGNDGSAGDAADAADAADASDAASTDIGLGDGRDGAQTISTTRNVNGYFPVLGPVPAGATSIRVATAPPPAPGEIAILWQPSGTAVTPPSNAVSIALTSNDGAGRYELVKIASVAGNDAVLERATTGAYEHPVQLVTVPRYTDLLIASAGVVTGKPFDGTSGGIIAFLATGTVTVNGRIDAGGLGFGGGEGAIGPDRKGCAAARGTRDEGYAYTGKGVSGGGNPLAGLGNIANGGGGGDCHNAGGGGGGHGGAGGVGGNSGGSDVPANRSVGGVGGAAIEYNPGTRLVMGGGGGAGESNDGFDGRAGRGGGVVLVRAATLAGPGNITASGSGAADNSISGAGGGGAGGLVFVTAAATTCGALIARGGRGGNSDSSGPGGGGAGGVVRHLPAPSACKIEVLGGPRGSATGGGVGAPARGAKDGVGGRGQ